MSIIKSTFDERKFELLFLRLPIGMRRALMTRAEASGRSIDAEVLTILGLALYSESYATLLSEDDLVHELKIRFGRSKKTPPDE